MRTTRRASVDVLALVVAAGALLLFAVYVRQTGQPDSAGAIGSIGPTPTVPPSASLAPIQTFQLTCGEYVASGLRIAHDVKGESALVDTVITGTVTAISDARWATTDGQPPIGYGATTAQDVYRVAEVRVTGIGKQPGGRAPLQPGSTIKIRVVGGTIGCWTFSFDGDFAFGTGDDVALFLLSGGEPVLKDAPPEDFDALDVWPIVDGVVVGRDVPMTPAQLLSISASVPYDPPYQ